MHLPFRPDRSDTRPGRVVTALAAALLAGACTSPLPIGAGPRPAGAVYAASNKADENTIVAYRQMSDGSLEWIGEYGTGGRGTGDLEVPGLELDASHPLKDGVDPLISAYGVYMTQDERHLLVVNAGDGSVSSLRVEPDYSLTLVAAVPAGERFPVSIASHGDLAYVASIGTEANGGAGSGNVRGYRIDAGGRLVPIPGATRDLGARPSCVAFTTDGRHLIVSELATGRLKSFAIAEDGAPSQRPVSVAGSPAASSRWLPIPVGIATTPGPDGTDTLIVSEARFLDRQGQLRRAANRVPQAPTYSWQTGSTSSYTVDADGQIRLVSPDVMTGRDVEDGQIANCWVAVSPDGGTVWAANALSSSLSAYDVGADGTLSLRHETAYKEASELLFFSDVFVSGDERYLNQLIGNRGSVLVLEIRSDGRLEPVGIYPGLPRIGAYGIVAI